ncbi:DUF4238 domain-containing protein [Burkholderia gladioli]|uniref:DUF4238 domain-containing protein n=1 Tax=Burkholderia gladioli TaxID=28095 RepID=UPI001FC8A6F9|nr:DUF4238 domain-containing protein [Burkholderia gladioli]
MKFEKTNHHYVPQHWQRGFRGANGHLYGKFRNGIRVVSPRTIMQQDYLYTVFDDQWNPSDSLEDALSAVEAEDAKLFQRLHSPGYTSTADDRNHLCAVLALQATRHPDILRRGTKRSRELGEVLANAHDYSLDEFKALMTGFAVSEADAHDCYIVLRSRSKEQLAEELTELTGLSPQSSQLPEQDALRAMPLVEQYLQPMELWLLDAPATEAFVLGDTPIPQSDLRQGFSVPLSRSLAVLACPAQTTPQKLLSRRSATTTEVRDINRTQNDNALDVVVGPSAALLATL